MTTVSCGCPRLLRHRLRACAPRASRGRSLPVVFVLALAVCLLIVPLHARAASKASVEAREENGFGRVVLNFDRLPAYRKQLDSGVFVIWFDDPVDAKVGEIPKDLPQYIGLARRDPDGRAIRLALNRSYLVNLMEAGHQLYIDILPLDWKGAPPPLPTHVIKALSRIAAEKERKAREEAAQREAAKFKYELDIRLARHPTFSRIVLDWNKFVTVNLARQGSQISIDFGAKADADLSALKVDGPKYLRNAELHKKANGMQLVLNVDDDVDVRGFREGLTYIVDLTSPDVAASASANRLAQTIGSASEAKKDTSVSEGAQHKTWLPAQNGSSETQADAQQAKDTDAPAIELGPEELHASQFGEEEAAIEEHAADKPEQPDEVADAAVKTKKSELPRAKAARKPVRVPANPEQAEPSAKPDDEVVVATAREAGGILRLTFPFNEKLSAAAFRRGHTIWMLFDTLSKLDVAALTKLPGGKVTGLRHIHTGSMQYLRLQLSRAWLTHVTNNDNTWSIDIGDMVSGQVKPLQLQRKLRDDRKSLMTIKLENPGRVHWLDDPEFGDRLAVVTAFAPQRSVAKPQDFVEFQAFATAHGIAIRPNSDDVNVRLKLDTVLITRRKGLTLSAGNVHQYMAGRKPLARTGRAGFLDAKAWEVRDPAKFSDRVHTLQRAVALSPDNKKNEKRFELAQLYFSRGFAMETLGVLQRMMQIDPALENDPAFMAMRGAVLTLAGRGAEARKDFEIHALANDPDAALWRGLLDADDKNWESALERFDEGADNIDTYRPDIKARFQLAAARSALALRRFRVAGKYLDAVAKQIEAPAMRVERNLLRGRYLASLGRNDEALEAYENVMRSSQRPAAAEAQLHKVKLLLAAKKLSRTDAIKSLETLQLVWRGDDTELGAMRLLANLYVQEDRYRDAFEIMKSGVINYPESRQARLMQDEMKQVFRDIYLNGDDSKMPPVQSLGLYYDFRELTPVGRQGDEMIRRLADKLIEFDLLDQAAEVLDHQVNKRLKGAARSQVATRLAMVHLMNHQPELALRTIRQTRQAGLPKHLRRSRSLLEARSLGELGRAEAAIEILNTIEGDDVEKYKADALWTAQKWDKTGEQLEKLFGSRWQKPEPLSDSERFNVLRAAIAYSLAGDQFALDRIRQKFYEKLVKTPDAASFLVVTEPIDSQGVPFRDLAKDIAGTDTLSSFMKEFRSKYDPSAKPARTSANPEQEGAS